MPAIISRALYLAGAKRTKDLPEKPTQRRKKDHLRIVSEEEVAHWQGTLLNDVQLVHNALSELALAEIDISAELFGKRLAAPLMVTSMSGGVDQGSRLNHDLAAVTGRLGIAFAVGSQRAQLEYPETREQFAVRPQIPDGVLLGNIGGQQLVEYPIERICELVKSIEADGICVHLNPAHEMAQDEGARDFRGILSAIGKLVSALEGRVVVKEVGNGLSADVVKRLQAVGVHVFDVAGSGGTSWPRVEQYRANDAGSRAVAETFADWGLPTAVCVIAARRAVGKQAVIIASGGVYSGLEAAKAIACGADLAGVARPVLEAWRDGGQLGVESYLKRVVHELKTTLILTGCPDLPALKQAPKLYTGKLAEWVNHFD